MNTKEINPEHNLYIIRVYNKDKSLIKLGYSSVINKRLLSYYNHNQLVELVGTYYREDAEDFENKLHRCIKSTARNEWYDEDKLNLILEYINNDVPEDLILDKYNKASSLEDLKKISMEYYGRIWADASEMKTKVEEYPIYLIAKSKICEMFVTGNIYTRKEVKNKLNILYKSVGLNRKAKHTDLYEVMTVKEIKINGERMVEIIQK